MPIVALMTDFGLHDHYVGVMKGVILQINPQATIVDITHEIDSQDLLHGAFVLRQVLPYFPAGTVFVAVIDPTVGTERRAVVAKYSGRVVLCPDNGLLTFLHRDADLEEIRVIENRQFFGNSRSDTFHGRDVFAPVAAHISRGLSLDHLGPPADHMEILDLAKPRLHDDGTVSGEVALIDHFGNLITNISAVDLSAGKTSKRDLHVTVGQHAVGPIRTTYADVSRGQPLALIGSTQMLEIAVNSGNAARELNASRGTPVTVG